MHRDAALRQLEPLDSYTYQVDVRYVGADGQLHWRGNIDTATSSVQL